MTASFLARSVDRIGPVSARLEFLQNRFAALFPNRFNSIVRSPRTDRWRTEPHKFYLTNHHIFQSISCESDRIRGCRWGDQTRFSILDIDVLSIYHNHDALKRLYDALAEIGIDRTKLYRSSKSGGWHIYIFWNDVVDSVQVSQLLRAWITAKGFKFKNGQLELFPSKNGTRLPLQRGFAWLSSSGELIREREHLSLEDALAQFLADLSVSANSPVDVIETAQSQLQTLDVTAQNTNDADLLTDFFDNAADSVDIKDELRWQQGRAYWLEGLTKPDTLHEAILYVGYYLWYGDPTLKVPSLAGRSNARQRQRVLQKWVETKHNGFATRINQGRWQTVHQDIQRAVNWQIADRNTTRIPYLLTERLIDRLIETKINTPEIFQKANEKREKEARDKINRAINEISLSGTEVSIRAIHRITGCSRNTIRRHQDLWLSDGSGDPSPVGGSALFVSPDDSRTTETTPEPMADVYTALTISGVLPFKVNVIATNTGEISRYSVFVLLSQAMGLAQCRLLSDTGARSWCLAHVEVFEKIGGAPKQLSVWSRRIRSAERLKQNAEFTRMLSHFGVTISNESETEDAETMHAISSILRKAMAQEFYSVHEATQFLEKELASCIEQRTKASDIKVELRALPKQSFKFKGIKTVLVNMDSHVGLSGHFYSVPNRLIGATVRCEYDDEQVSIFREDALVAKHSWSIRRGAFTTIQEHMYPDDHPVVRKVLRRILEWSDRVGYDVGRLVLELMDRAEFRLHAVRTAMNILSLEKKVGGKLLNEACAACLQNNALNYRDVKYALERLPATCQQA